MESLTIKIIKSNIRKHIYFLVLCFLIKNFIYAESLTPNGRARILFLAQQGNHTKALDAYNQYFAVNHEHDFELLHQIGLSIVEYGFRQSNPESQLFAVFGASIAAHEDAFFILEQSLKSKYPQIQLVALNAISRLQHHQADRALYQALGSPELIIRLEAAHQLCIKKHPQAVSQTESLMYKVPKEFLPIFPTLYAAVGDEKAIRILRKMLNDSSEKVRIATTLSLAKAKRDDLLPQLRQQIFNFSYGQQEALAYTLGILKDEISISKLKILSKSQYKNVALAANNALIQLGQKDALAEIEKAAEEKNIFAIRILGQNNEGKKILKQLIQSSDIQVRTNAGIALLDQFDIDCLPVVLELLLRNKQDLAIIEIKSPGLAFKGWKIVQSASQVLKDDLEAYSATLNFREEILNQAQHLPESDFLKLAEMILINQQNDLVPLTVELLENLGTSQSIALLKKYHQKIGAPLVRNYCNLALYRLKEPGPYGDLLKQWVKSQNDQALIRFRALLPWQFENSYQLTPEETSRLLIGAFEAYAINQDNQGIETLLEAIENGHPQNRYALAGLLIRATQ